jgi:hypothetical protein
MQVDYEYMFKLCKNYIFRRGEKLRLCMTIENTRVKNCKNVALDRGEWTQIRKKARAQ